jgi:uncharacterized membrane protein
LALKRSLGKHPSRSRGCTFDIDRKRARTNPKEWERYRNATSSLPLAAILQDRNRLVARELVVPLLIGGLLTVALVHFHARWFGASPLA